MRSADCACGHRSAALARPLGLLLAGGLAAPVLTGCQVRALQPRGPAAREIAGLWWFMFAIGAAVFLVVTVVLLAALWRHRRRDPVEPRNAGRTMMVWGGAIVPMVIVLALMAYTVRTLDTTTAPLGQGDLTIDVYSHMWWWEAHYPEQGFAIANEIHIPVGRPVNIQLHGEDVIHSFWVPELHGKRDMTPGISAPFWLQADEPGEYRGQCAEFCGLQHARMRFLVIAHEPEEFDAWLERTQQPARDPVADITFRGQQVFLGSECVYCHTVRGTNASGTLGPDLTNIASRQELGAGTLPNTPGTLAAWIIDAQHFKPGNHMPPMPLPSEDLLAMLSYMATLN